MPDPLDVGRVRDLPECELNERVEPAGAGGRAARLGVALAVGVGAGATVARVAFDPIDGEVAAAWRVVLVLGALYVGTAWVFHPPLVRPAATVLAAWAFAGLFAWGQGFVVGPGPTVRVTLACGAALALGVGHLVAGQYVFFATANMARPWPQSLRWRAYWAAAARFRAVPGRPAVSAYRRAALPVGVGVACGWALSGSRLGPLTGALAGYAAGVAGTAGLLWPRGVSPPDAVRAALAAVRVFLAYQPTPTPAPGVFRLPTRWLRPHAARLTLGGLALLPLAWAAADLPTVYNAPLLTVYRSFNGTGSGRESPVTAAESEFFDSLPPDDRDEYVRVLVARRAAEARLEALTRREYNRALLTAAAAGSVLPAAVFLLTFVATAGPLLAAVHTVFEEGREE